MNDRVGRLGAEDVGERRAADVDHVEPRRRVDLLPPPRAQVVDDGHLVTRLDATIDHVRADESRSAGDEDLHDAALCEGSRLLPSHSWGRPWEGRGFALRLAP